MPLVPLTHCNARLTEAFGLTRFTLLRVPFPYLYVKVIRFCGYTLVRWEETEAGLTQPRWDMHFGGSSAVCYDGRHLFGCHLMYE